MSDVPDLQQTHDSIVHVPPQTAMDVAYDHIQEEALSLSTSTNTRPTASSSSTDAATNEATAQSPDLNTEFQQAFKAVQSSPWGTAIGGWFSTARKQGETFYQDLQKEASDAQEQATKGFSSLREQVAQRTRGMSLGGGEGAGLEQTVPGEEAVPVAAAAEKEKEKERGDAEDTDGKPESLPADIVKEAGSLVASLRLTAASKLKDLQRAEDAADEALLKFGTNVRDFLRDAVVITAPAEGSQGGKDSEVLFETSEPGTGKKVFHSTRLDAQLHAIHTTATSFTVDPAEGEAWEVWTAGFDVDNKTQEIAADLEKYEELRRAMEKLVPEKVEYKTFWTRYYFLRSAVEEDERKRREVLKGAFILLHHIHQRTVLTWACSHRRRRRPRRRRRMGRRRRRYPDPQQSRHVIDNDTQCSGSRTTSRQRPPQTDQVSTT